MKNKKIYFLGIGGIGMSALAQYFLQSGNQVYGYDLTQTHLTDFLSDKGALIHYDCDVSKIPSDIDFVVYTPAISVDFPEYQYFVENNIPIYKRSQILGMITSEYKTIAVAGTHGKTTTTSLVSHLFNTENSHLLAFIGGISKNFNDNYIFNGENNSDDCVAVVEADEFDRSFLTLHPQISTITSIDADHLDIYQNKSNLIDAFQQFANQSEALFVEENVADSIAKSSNKYVYGFSPSCDCYPLNIQYDTLKIRFDLHTPFADLENLELQIPGKYNLLNATAAISAFLFFKKSYNDFQLSELQEDINNQVQTFSGVKRRFDIIVDEEDFVYIDDYAHHPKEISSFCNAVCELFPRKRICGIFQPHLYSRTRDFADDFAKSLSVLDEVILLPIYPAREKPISGINSGFLLEKITSKQKILLQKDQVFDYLKHNMPDVLLTIGAGDIDRLVDKLKLLK